MQSRQFQENMALNLRGTQLNRQFAQVEWGYQDQTRALQWAWQQEDFQEQRRFMTGRDRRLAERQMARQTVMHDIEGERIDTQRSQQKQLWKLEDERFITQKRHFEEQLQMQREQLETARGFFEERKRLEEEQIAMQRAYQMLQFDFQKQQIDAQAGYAAAIHKAKTELEQFQRAQEDELANFKMAWEYASLAKDFLQAMADFAQDLSSLGYQLPVGRQGSTQKPSGGTGTTEIVNASGGDFIVPAGYDNDDYPIKARSGEHVRVTMPFADSAKPWSPWQNTVTSSKPVQERRQPAVINVYVGDQLLKSFIVDTIEADVRI
jgi:hypothetical protein